MCILAEQEVGIDVQVHRKANFKRMLKRMVPAEMIGEILASDDAEKAFFTQWALREAYIKWTGEGLSRNLCTIPMDEGHYTVFEELKPGYTGAVWSAEPLKLRWEYRETDFTAGGE